MKMQKIPLVVLTGTLLSVGTVSFADPASASVSPSRNGAPKASGHSGNVGKTGTTTMSGTAGGSPSSASTAAVPYVRPPR